MRDPVKRFRLAYSTLVVVVTVDRFRHSFHSKMFWHPLIYFQCFRGWHSCHHDTLTWLRRWPSTSRSGTTDLTSSPPVTIITPSLSASSSVLTCRGTDTVLSNALFLALTTFLHIVKYFWLVYSSCMYIVVVTPVAAVDSCSCRSSRQHIVLSKRNLGSRSGFQQRSVSSIKDSHSSNSVL